MKYAMDVLHLTRTQMGEIEDARARGIKRLLKLPNSTDGKFCRLPRHKGGCGFKQLAPIISQIAAEALVQDLDCPGPTGHLARHLLKFQMNEKKLTSLKREHHSMDPRALASSPELAPGSPRGREWTDYRLERRGLHRPHRR